MNTRRLSLAGVAAVALVLLSACSDAPAPRPPGEDALAYVELLRGENDLAHGSLEVPATSSLPEAAAAIRALRHAGRTAPRLDDETLARLVQRTGDEPAWVAGQLCEATGDDPRAVERVFGDEGVAAVLTADLPEVTSVNAVADLVMLETTRLCLGAAVSLDAATRAALERHSAGNALVGARLAQLYSRLDLASPRGLLDGGDVSDLAAAIAAEGCSQWLFAHSVAALRLGAVSEGAKDGASRSIRDCAGSTTVPLTEATSLSYAIDAGLSAEQTGLLLDHNASALAAWLAVEPRTAVAGDSPIGLGTIAWTRDALALLRLRGVTEPPGWMRDGVVAASRGDVEPADRIDLLHACDSLEAACDEEFVSAATHELTVRAATVVEDVRAARLDDSSGARLVETAIALDVLASEHCAGDRAAELYVEAPQLLAALATVEKSCVETLDLDDDRAATDVEQALDDLRPDDALALCLLRSLASEGNGQPSTFSARSRAALDRLWLQFDAEHGADFLRTARPLRVELLTAKADQWLE